MFNYNRFMKERVYWCDIAKSIGIFLMVCGHTSIPSIISNWIYSFHMPLFFIISGFFFSKKGEGMLAPYIIRKVKSLLVPYFKYSIVVYVGMILIGVPDYHALLVGWKGYALWFIPVLFFTEICFALLVKINYYYVVVFLMGGIGYVLYENVIFLPYKIEVVFSSVMFFFLGYICRDILRTIKPNMIVIIVVFISNFLIAQLLPKLDLCWNYYGWSVLNIINACIGCLGVFLLSKKIEKYGIENKFVKLLIGFGKNTIVIVGLSQLFNLILKNMFSLIQIQYEVSFVLRFCLLWLLLWGVVKYKKYLYL